MLWRSYPSCSARRISSGFRAKKVSAPVPMGYLEFPGCWRTPRTDRGVSRGCAPVVGSGDLGRHCAGRRAGRPDRSRPDRDSGSGHRRRQPGNRRLADHRSARHAAAGGLDPCARRRSPRRRHARPVVPAAADDHAVRARRRARRIRRLGTQVSGRTRRRHDRPARRPARLLGSARGLDRSRPQHLAPRAARRLAGRRTDCRCIGPGPRAGRGALHQPMSAATA